MSFGKSFMLAIKSIFSSKMRAFLTMLGVIIGVAAVIILVSLMDGLTNTVTDTFESMGTNTITVSIQDRGTKEVKVEEMEEFVEENEYLTMFSPTVSVAGFVKDGSDYLQTSITGVNEVYKDIKDYTIGNGRFINYVDLVQEQKVCVIGTYIQKELFSGLNPLGEYVRINGERYLVVGVLEEIGDSSETSSDNCIFIPYTVARKVNFSSKVGSYILVNSDDTQRELVVSQIEKFLLNKVGDDDYYTVTSMAEILDSLTEITDSMKSMLVAIAGISLLVGGIGIMNIMLVSVTERTREIGIRKSLGAKAKDIMSQFVIEAGTVSSIGGLIGIILGGTVSVVIGNMVGINAFPSISAIAVSFGVSVGIGLLFGYLPAKKAAKLNPIDALRYD